MIKAQRKRNKARGATASRGKRLADLECSLQRLSEHTQSLETALGRSLDELDAARASWEEVRNLLEARKLIPGRGELPAYQQLVQRIHQAVRSHIPRGATVIVVSKGDPQLLRLPGREGWHFPQQADGRYAGFYPSNSLSAIAHLEALRARGAGYLLFPASAFWWREKYAEFYRHIERRYRQVIRDEQSCAVFSLREPSPWLPVEEAITATRGRLGREPVILDWDTGRALADVFPESTVFSPPQRSATLPYLDHTIDLVAVNAGNEVSRAEAERVAATAVIEFKGGPGAAGELELRWRVETGADARTAVSIIVPAGARWSALAETLPRSFAGEIIVVDESGNGKPLDDGSTPDLPFARWKQVECQAGAGWPEAAARAAKAASGGIVVFISREVLLLPGWWPPLLQLFARRPDAGAAGGRLLFPDGRLREAGGILQPDGRAASFGEGDFQTCASRYVCVRETDFCSAKLLAVRRELFLKCGGFKPGKRDGARGDVALGARLREKGWRVFYQPQSLCVEMEPTPPGPSLRSQGSGNPTSTP